MAEFGWAYIEGGALTGSGGEHGSIQFRTPGGVNGSKDFIYDTGSGRVAIGVDWPNLDGKTVPNAMLHVNGDVSVTGTIYASQYQIAEVTSIQSSGDSRFGNSSGDIHEFTGSVKVEGNMTLGTADTHTIEVKGVLTASADVIVADDKKIYFGTGKDASFEYDEDGTDTLLYAGSSIRISDDTKIEFGSGGDATIEYDENGTNELRFAGAAVLFEQIVTHEAHPIFETGITIKNADASAGYINFYEQSSNGTNVCTFRGKSSMGNCTITLPGQTGTVVLEDNTVTLSNKTLSAPTITGAATFDGNVTLGDAETDVVTLTGRATASAGLMITDGTAQDNGLQIGTGGDFYIAHDGTDTAIANATGKLKISSTVNSADAIRIKANGGTSETIFIRADQGTSVMTDGNSNASIQLKSDDGGIGIRSTANLAGSIQIEADGGTSETIIIKADQGTSVTEGASSIQLLSDAGGVELKSAANLAKSIKLIADGGTSETIYIQSDQGTGADSIHLLSDAGGITLQVGSGKLVTVNGGDLVPSADNTLDLGAADKRWQNIYTGDLHLKNDRGDWTIVEESDYLSLRNNGTGKLYKFVLEEVDEE